MTLETSAQDTETPYNTEIKLYNNPNLYIHGPSFDLTLGERLFLNVWFYNPFSPTNERHLGIYEVVEKEVTNSAFEREYKLKKIKEFVISSLLEKLLSEQESEEFYKHIRALPYISTDVSNGIINCCRRGI